MQPHVEPIWCSYIPDAGYACPHGHARARRLYTRRDDLRTPPQYGCYSYGSRCFLISLLFIEVVRYILGLSPRRQTGMGRLGPGAATCEGEWLGSHLFSQFLVTFVSHVFIFHMFATFWNLIHFVQCFPSFFASFVHCFALVHSFFTFFMLLFTFSFFPRNGAESKKTLVCLQKTAENNEQTRVKTT